MNFKIHEVKIYVTERKKIEKNPQLYLGVLMFSIIDKNARQRSGKM